MKPILMSLSPYWYYLICEGIKSIEVRSRIPKDQNWNKKVACYMTKDKKSFNRIPKEFQEKYKTHFGKVGMQFMCDKIENIDIPYPAYFSEVKNREELENKTCLTLMQMHQYSKDRLYGLHISDLKIYDKPKELGEFFVKGECPEENCGFCKNFHRGRRWLNGDTYDENDCIVYGIKPITRPPRSWLYVEEL